MPAPTTLAELQDREDAEAERLATAAGIAGLGAISATSVAVGRKAVRAIASLHGDDAINTQAIDLRALRSDPGVNEARQADTDRANAYLLDAITGWIVAGWQAEAEGQAAILSGKGMRLDVELTDDDRHDLADFPIQGYSATEVRRHLVYMLGHDFDGALAATSTALPDAVIAALGEAAKRHATRLQQACRECYFAGVQAARFDIGAALTGGE